MVSVQVLRVTEVELVHFFVCFVGCAHLNSNCFFFSPAESFTDS